MILPFNIADSHKIEIENVTFQVIGTKFSGEGTLFWDLKNGFKLEAKVSPKNKVKLKGKKSCGGAKVIPKKLLRFSINRMWKAYTFSPFSELYEIPLLFNSGKISINFDNLIFFTDAIFNKEENIVKGKCFFQISEATYLPDLVVRETKILDTIVSQSKKYEGIFIQDEFIKIQGYINDEGFLDISWEIQKETISKKSQWDISTAIRDALSICLGQVVSIVRRDIYRSDKSIVEFFKEQEIVDLGFFNPIPSNYCLNKELFLKLIKIFISDEKNSNIIRNLFFRIADSMRIKNFAIWQFMISTSLEAFLRTYYNKPFYFGKNKDPFKGIDFYLSEFKKEYFENDYLKEWRKVFKNVKRSYLELRHINAHPDWLNSSDLISSQEKLNAMKYLTKFYGYVILSLLGYKNLKPEM